MYKFSHNSRCIIRIVDGAFIPINEENSDYQRVKRWEFEGNIIESSIPVAIIPIQIKNEARRRISEKFPEWKQTNMVARGVELQDIWRLNGVWTAQEQAEATALKSVWTWIKSVRTASDTLEAMIPIPLNYENDVHWPPMQ